MVLINSNVIDLLFVKNVEPGFDPHPCAMLGCYILQGIKDILFDRGTVCCCEGVIVAKISIIHKIYLYIFR